MRPVPTLRTDKSPNSANPHKMSATVQYPKSWEEMRAMAIENRDMKELITNLMTNAASNGGTSTALVDASPWASALTVEQVKSRAATKKPKGHRAAAAVAQVADSGSDDSEPLPRRNHPKGAIGKKRRQKKDPNAPKKPLTGYTYFVQENRPECYNELAAKATEANEPKPKNPEVLTLCASKWRLVTEEGRAEWKAKAEKKNRDNMEAARSGATAGGASPSSVMAAADEDF